MIDGKDDRYPYYTALMGASYQGHTAIVQLLLEHGAQVDVQDKYGRTALMSASSHGYAEACLMLLQHGARIDIQENCGKTALIFAVSISRFGAIQVLMEHKALLTVNDAVLAEYYTKFSSHPVATASDEQEDSSEDSSEEEEEEAADPIVIKSICDLIKREQNWRRRLPWLMVWLALNKSVAAAAATAVSGTLTIQEDVLSHDWVGRRVASYL